MQSTRTHLNYQNSKNGSDPLSMKFFNYSPRKYQAFENAFFAKWHHFSLVLSIHNYGKNFHCFEKFLRKKNFIKTLIPHTRTKIPLSLSSNTQFEIFKPFYIFWRICYFVVTKSKLLYKLLITLGNSALIYCIRTVQYSLYFFQKKKISIFCYIKAMTNKQSFIWLWDDRRKKISNTKHFLVLFFFTFKTILAGRFWY